MKNEQKYERESRPATEGRAREEEFPQKRPQASDLRSGAARETDGSVSQRQHPVCKGTGEAVPKLAFLEHIPGVAGEKGEGPRAIQVRSPSRGGGGTYLDHKLLSQLVLAIQSHWVENNAVVTGAQGGDGHDSHHLLIDIWHMGFRVLHRHQPLLPSTAHHSPQVSEVLQSPEVQGCLQSKTLACLSKPTSNFLRVPGNPTSHKMLRSQ